MTESLAPPVPAHRPFNLGVPQAPSAQPWGEVKADARIKNPGAMTKLRFRMDTMSTAESRTYRRDALLRNEMKLERGVEKLIAKAGAFSEGRACKVSGDVAAGLGAVVRRVEKLRNYSDPGRSDGMVAMVKEQYGKRDVPVQQLIDKAVGILLREGPDNVGERAMEFLYGSNEDVGGAKALIGERLNDVIGSSSKKLERRVISRNVLNAFHKARQDGALRVALTAEKLDAGTLISIGKHVQADRNALPPLAEMLGALGGAAGGQPGGAAVDSARPQPTLESLERGFDCLTMDQRKALARRLDHARAQCGQLMRNGEAGLAEDLIAGIETLKEVFNGREAMAVASFVRYGKNQELLDVESLTARYRKFSLFSGPTGSSRPGTLARLKNFGRKLVAMLTFRGKVNSETAWNRAIDTVVAGARQAGGVYRNESLFSNKIGADYQGLRDRYYMEISQRVMDNVANAMGNVGRADMVSVRAQVILALRTADAIQTAKDVAALAGLRSAQAAPVPPVTIAAQETTAMPLERAPSLPHAPTDDWSDDGEFDDDDDYGENIANVTYDKVVEGLENLENLENLDNLEDIRNILPPPQALTRQPLATVSEEDGYLQSTRLPRRAGLSRRA